MSHDIDQARRFLTLLDETAEKFTFQTFNDKKIEDSGPDVLANWFHGDIDSLFTRLVNYNRLGAGIFVMVQSGDGTGRNTKAVDRIRCIFNENDHGLVRDYPPGIEPHIIVESSPGKQHHYFMCNGLELADFKPIQWRMINDYGSDPNAHDLPRVLRVPGFYHNKENPHLVSILHESGEQAYSRDQLITAFPPSAKPQKTASGSSGDDTGGKISEAQVLALRSALNWLDCDDYKEWIEVGIALKNIGMDGKSLWLDWSSTSDKFDRGQAFEKWDSFTADSAGYKSVFWKAAAAGWVNTAKKAAVGDGDIGTVTDGLTWSCADGMADSARAPEFLINNILETDSHGMLAGDSMAFKTFVDLRMAYSVCTGKDFFGHEVYTTGKVLYVCGEGRGSLARRIKALKIAESDFNGNLMVLDNHIRIDNAVDMAALRLEVLSINPILVIFDTFGSLIGNTDENSNSDVGKSLLMIKDTCRQGKTCSLIVHHYGKDSSKGMRGAIAFKANVDFEMSLERQMPSFTTVLSSIKMKDGENFAPIAMEAQVIDLGLIRQDGKSSTSLAMKAAQEGFFSANSGMNYDLLQIMVAIDSAIEKYGFKHYFDGSSAMAINLSELRPIAYPMIIAAQNSKRTILSNRLKTLVSLGKILFINNIIWISEAEEAQRRAQ